MILLFNVKITNARRFNYRQSAHYPNDDRMDVFKYCLASHAALLPLVSKAIFYIRISEEFKHRTDELSNYIKSLFPEDKLELIWDRNDTQEEWKLVYEKIKDIPDDLIWMAGNDDHVFIDSNIDTLKNGLDLLEKDENPLAMLYYSHWPEQMRMAKYNNAELLEGGEYVKYNWSSFDSIQIIKKERFRQYWFEGEHVSTMRHAGVLITDMLFKTDNLLHVRGPMTAPAYVPTKEMVRHFDGYGHIGNFNNSTPPLFIPPGFWDNEINIKYGFQDRDNNFTNLNPSHSLLYAGSPVGTDYRWAPEDIPIFWKDKVNSLIKNEGINEEEMKKARNENIIKCSRENMNCYNVLFQNNHQPPEEWFKKHFI